MIPTPGRIVEYTLNEHDADQINKRRDDSRKSGLAARETGAVIHVGNRVSPGESYPMVIVRAWGNTEGSAVNGQVLLDGNDTFWATSRQQGEGPFCWREYART